MGLHSKVRCEITLKGKNRVEQADEIVRFTEELYRFIYNQAVRLPQLCIVNCELKNSTITIDIAEQKSYNSTVTKIEVLYKWRKEKFFTQN